MCVRVLIHPVITTLCIMTYVCVNTPCHHHPMHYDGVCVCVNAPCHHHPMHYDGMCVFVNTPCHHHYMHYDVCVLINPVITALQMIGLILTLKVHIMQSITINEFTAARVYRK